MPRVETYIERPVDQNLLQSIQLPGLYHVLSPIHTGKTKLIKATSSKLHNDFGGRFRCASVCLRQMFRGETPLRKDDINGFYRKLTQNLAEFFSARSSIPEFSDKYRVFRENQGSSSGNSLVAQFLRDVILTHENDPPVVIFFDHIEELFEQSSDENGMLFALRSFFTSVYELCTQFPDQLSIALVGSVSRAELQQYSHSEFMNRIQQIEVQDFTDVDIKKAVETNEHRLQSLVQKFATYETGLRRVIEFTEGNVFLTTKLLTEIAKTSGKIQPGDELRIIRESVYSDIIQEEHTLDHFSEIKRRLCENGNQLLNIYIKHQSSLESNGLRLTSLENLTEKRLIQKLEFIGIIKNRPGDGFRVHNQIYKMVLEQWILAEQNTTTNQSPPPSTHLSSSLPPSPQQSARPVEPSLPRSTEGEPPGVSTPIVATFRRIVEGLKSFLESFPFVAPIASFVAWFISLIPDSAIWSGLATYGAKLKAFPGWMREKISRRHKEHSRPPRGRRPRIGRIVGVLVVVSSVLVYLASPMFYPASLMMDAWHKPQVLTALEKMKDDQIEALEMAIEASDRAKKLQPYLDKISEVLRTRLPFDPLTTSRFVLQQILSKINVQNRIESGYKSFSRLALSPDGQKIAAAGIKNQDGIVTILDRKGKALETIKSGQGTVEDLNFRKDNDKDNDSRYLATVGRSEGGQVKFKVWDLQSEMKSPVISAPIPGEKGGDWLRSVSFSSDGRKVAVSAESGKVYLWTISTLTRSIQVKRLEPPISHDQSVRSLIFHPKKDILVTASTDGVLRIWNLNRNPAVFVNKLEPQLGSLNRVSFNADGSLLAVAGDKGVQVFRMLESQELQQKVEVLLDDRQSNPIQDISFSKPMSQDRFLLAAVGDSGILKVWYFIPQKPAITLLDVGIYGVQKPTTVSFDPASSDEEPQLILAGASKIIQVWNLKNLMKPLTDFVLNEHQDSVRAISSRSPKININATAVTVGNDRRARVLWSHGSPCAKAEMNQAYGGITSASFLPDSPKFMTAHENGTVYFWNAKECEQVTSNDSWDTRQKNITSIAFKPEEPEFTTFAMADQDGIKFWQNPSRTSAQSAIDVKGVRYISYNRDGSAFLALTTTFSNSTNAIDVNGIVNVWKVKNQKVDTLNSVLISDTAGIDDVRFTPDGKHLATVSSENEQVVFRDLDKNNAGSFSLNFSPQSMPTSISKGAVRLSFDATGTLLAIARDTGVVEIWDVSNIDWDRLKNQTKEFWASRKIATFGIPVGVDSQRIGISSLAFFGKNYIYVGRENGSINFLPIPEFEQLLNDGCKWLDDYRDRSKVSKICPN